MFIFGGWDGQETLNDILEYQITTNSWKIIEGTKGSIKGRYRHTAVANDHAMFIFGGIDQ